MFTGIEIVGLLEELGVTHVIWVPDSTMGQWEQAIEASESLCLVRVCREGEAWPLAAGLHVGGKFPMVLMQSTGLFESGDAMRNVVMDLRVPLIAIIGVRNWKIPESTDSAKQFAQPIVQAWGLQSTWIEHERDQPRLAKLYRESRRSQTPALILMAEGKG